MSITPLRKKTLKGTVYVRNPEVEAKLVELSTLSHKELVVRCVILAREDPEYVPSECLLYFARSCRNDTSDVHFEDLYNILAERILRRLPRAESVDDKTISLTKSGVREAALDRFVELLMSDRQKYSEKLDFYEVRFDSAVKKLHIDAQRKILPRAKLSVPLETEETGEISTEVEHATGSFDPFDASRFNDADYRLRLDAAIDSLPLLQRRIVEMRLQDIPIDSKEPDVVTIAETLGKSEKTIRTHRDKAYTALKIMLMQGEMP